eukprot:2373901-Amphidinium_carterae.1
MEVNGRRVRHSHVLATADNIKIHKSLWVQSLESSRAAETLISKCSPLNPITSNDYKTKPSHAAYFLGCTQMWAIRHEPSDSFRSNSKVGISMLTAPALGIGLVHKVNADESWIDILKIPSTKKFLRHYFKRKDQPNTQHLCYSADTVPRRDQQQNAATTKDAATTNQTR